MRNPFSLRQPKSPFSNRPFSGGLAPAVVNFLRYQTDYLGGTLAMGSVQFQAGEVAGSALPTDVAGGHMGFAGTNVLQATDETKAPLLAILNGGAWAVHTPVSQATLALGAMWSAHTGVNGESFVSGYLLADGDVRFMLDGPGVVAVQNVDTTTTPITPGGDHLVSFIYHTDPASASGVSVSIYVDGFPLITDRAVTEANIADPFTDFSIGARVGSTNANALTGTIKQGMTIQRLTGNTREGQVLQACAEMARIMDAYAYLDRVDVVLATGAGQSNILGSGTDNANALDLADGTLYGVDVVNESLRRIFFDLDDLNVVGNTRITAQSPFSGFADQMLADTGLPTLAAQMGVTGSPLLDASAGGQAHWELTGDDSNGLLTAPTAIATNAADAPAQADLLGHIETTIALQPGFRVAHRVVLWDQSQADSGGMTAGSGPTGDATYQAALEGVADHFFAAGYDAFVLVEAPTQGADQTVVNTNEPGKILLRGAQAGAVASDPRIVWGPRIGASVGDPFNTLTVDADGAYVSGRSFQDDGTHYDQVMAQAVGRRFAIQAADALGLYGAPTATGSLADQTYTQNSGVQTVDASAAFTGGAIVWSVNGAGASIDALGVVSIPTTDLLAGALVTVTAANSAGSAQSSFVLSVTAAAAADYRIVTAMEYAHSLTRHFREPTDADYQSPDYSAIDQQWYLSDHAGVAYKGEMTFGQYSEPWTMPPGGRVNPGAAARPRFNWSSGDGGQSLVTEGVTDFVFSPPNFIQTGTTPSDGLPGESIIDRTVEIVQAFRALPGAPNPIVWLNTVWPKPYGTTGDTLNAAYITQMITDALPGGVYYEWCQDWLEGVQAADPTIDVRLMDQAVILADLLQTTVLSTLTPTEIFEDNAPHGRSLIYAVSAAIRFGIMQGLAVPNDWLPVADPTNPTLVPIPQAVLDGFPAIIDRINELLGYTGSTVAWNLRGIEDYLPWWRYVNIAKHFREPATVLAANKDANGYPVRMGGLTQIDYLMDLAHWDVADLVGPYEITWDGQGTAQLAGSVGNVVQTGNRFNFDITGNGSITFRITALPSDTDYIRNLVMVRDTPEWKVLQAAGTIDNPEFVSSLRVNGKAPAQVRHMNDMHVNNNPTTLWSDYPQESSVSWERGEPVSVMTKRAAAAGYMPYFNVPYHFDDNAVTQMALQIRANLAPDQRFLAGYSNEVWNFLFQQTEDALRDSNVAWGAPVASASWVNGSNVVTVNDATGFAAGAGQVLTLVAGDGSREHGGVTAVNGNDITITRFVGLPTGSGVGYRGGYWQQSWQLKRAVEVADLIDAALGVDADRVIHVLEFQTTNNAARLAEVLDGPQWQISEPGNYVSGRERFDVVAGATYYGTEMIFSGDQTDITALRNQIATQTFDVAAQWYQDYLLNPASAHGTQKLRNDLTACRAEIAGDNLRLISYEGMADHVAYGGAEASLWQFVRQFVDSPYGTPVLAEMYAIHKDLVDGPAMCFTHSGLDSQAGVWAFRPGLNEPSGRFSDLEALDAANVPWWPDYPVNVPAGGVVVPTVANPIADQALQDDGADVVIDLDAVFTDGGGTNAYDFVSTVAGVTISGSNLTIAPATVGVLASTNIVVRATNAAGNVTDTFALEVTAAPAATPVLLNGTQSISFPGTSGANTFQLDYYGILFSALPSANAFLWGLENGATDQVMWVQTSGRLAINIAGATPGDFVQTSSNIPIGTKFDLRFQYSSAGDLEGSNTLAIYINGGLVLTRSGTGVQNLTNSYLFGDTNNLGHPTMSIDGVAITVNGVLELNLNPGSPTLFNSNLDRDGKPFSHKGTFN